MVLELVDEKGLRRARPLQRQRVDRAHRPGAPGSKQQGAAVRRDVTRPLVLRRHQQRLGRARAVGGNPVQVPLAELAARVHNAPAVRSPDGDRKSTRLNSSHEWISYAVFCLKKKKKRYEKRNTRELEAATNSNTSMVTEMI